ncbi:MAG TPA: type II toxin-antitoxin system HicA family toxin [Firmicutes bacterium]|nr:type II toxin-antitoxin system HicA family toxin [Bacillota bacterium]
MRLPRDINAQQLVTALGKLGYQVTRITGSHIRLTKIGTGGEYHITIPNHNPLRVGTLNAILKEIAVQENMSKNKLLTKLF